jgi:sugar O-acyltransferase (sialic acid O-acetyltransferase NeuD family)
MKVVVYGASGHGKVVAEILLASGHALEGFVDDGVAAGTLVLGRPVLGDAEWLTTHAGTLDGVALGVGANRGRALVAARIRAAGAALISALHPHSIIAPTARIGEGAVVMAGAVINSDAVIGAGAIINTGCVVEHDCKIGDYAHIGPQVALGGTVEVGEFAQIGIGAVVSNNIAIGSHSVIGAGAAVVHSIPEKVVAYGVPARPRRSIEVETTPERADRTRGRNLHPSH